MPRIVYVIIFLFFTITPFALVKVAEVLLGVDTQPPAQTTTNQTTGNNYNDHYHGSHYHSHYYHRPYYGGFFYYGGRGRGGWMGRNYRSYNKSSGSGGFFGSSRSYSGGTSSYKGGSFGSFGK